MGDGGVSMPWFQYVEPVTPKKPRTDPAIECGGPVHFLYSPQCSPHRWGTDRVPEPALSFRVMGKIRISARWHFTRNYPDIYRTCWVWCWVLQYLPNKKGLRISPKPLLLFW